MSVLDLKLQDGDLPIDRTLGIQWNVKTDQFGFNVAVKDKPITRRGILSMVSSIYDPLGFVVPFILNAKILLQDLCVQGLGWDETVGQVDAARWNQWLAELPQLCAIEIDRCYKSDTGCDNEQKHELHVLCDASQRGYAAVVYLRTITKDGSIHCSFVMGKTRLAPVKSLTIPRLELSAAVLACTLLETVQTELGLSISEVTYWTDSTSVLQYIRNESRRFHVFVANRVAKIQGASEIAQWRYVPTQLNPADDGSRGLHARELSKCCRWLTGPDFLKEEKDGWPTVPPVLSEPMTDILQQDPEVKRGHAHSTNRLDSVSRLILRYSDWNQLKRGVAWIMRFKVYLKGKKGEECIKPTGSKCLTVQELGEAEKIILSYVQREAFPEEFRRDNKSRQQKSGTCLVRLNPINVEGVLKVGGRLQNSPISEDAKHPVILPSNHHVTSLIITHYHQEVGHSGAGMTWANLREKYWVIRGNATVRKVIGNCIGCKRRNTQRGEQLMADLPAERVTPDNPPFTNTGVDYFGPFLVKRGRAHVKRYGCIFTCLASRAVHLEVATSLDTDAFINTLRRFINRRGCPRKILSDNGTNFKGGYRELKESLAALSTQKVDRFLTQKGIQWEFNPPGASHFGGVWERLIRSVRRILDALLRQQTVTDDSLSTLMTEVEAILNTRPLTPISQDPADAEPLTPSHLLLMRRNPSLPPGLFVKDDCYSRRRWRQVQYLADQFWRRWVREYLPLLQQRQKWTTQQRNFAVDDLVLVVEDNTPRGQWALGRVVRTFPDKAGLVRQVEVRIGTKCYKRPISKLCLLESASVKGCNRG